MTTSVITKSIGGWIFEALELRNRGMPKESFRLLLDGDPIPEKASQIFGAVKGDATRQAALDMLFERGIFPRPYLRWDFPFKPCRWNHLPEAIGKLLNHEFASFIEFNFDLGALLDPERLIDARATWTKENWQGEWDLRQRDVFDTAPPLPPWDILCRKGKLLVKLDHDCTN